MEIHKKLLEEIGCCAKELHSTISVIENVTSGFVHFSLSQINQSYDFLKGGLIVNNPEQLKALPANENYFSNSEDVSESTAEQMAITASKIFGSDWGIGITGFAAPEENSEFKTYTYFSFAYKQEIVLTKFLELHPLTNFMEAKIYYTEFLLGCLKCELNKMLFQIKVS